jgi:apolipoprotein N-acyltransferase
VQSTWAAWLVAPLAYTAVDWARGEIWFDGYPWFLLGHPTLDAPVIGADMAGTVGQYGATLLCSLAAAALAAGVHGLLARRRNAPVSTAARPSRRVCLGLVAGPLILAGAWLVLDVLHLGAPAPHVAIAASPDHMPVGDADAGPDANNILIAVVQTNVPQSNKLVWTPQQKLADYQRFMQLTQIASLRGLFADEVNASLAGRGAIAHSSADAPLGSQTTAEVALRDMQRRGVIVWPETMFPEPSLAPDALAAWRAEERRAGREPGSTLAVAMAEDLLASQAASGVPMIVGMLGLQDVEFREINIDTPNGVTTERRMHPDRRHNSAALLARGGVAQRYDKVHLTPFGEVMPYISRIDWLERMLLAIGASGMTFDIDRGDARQPLVVTLGGQSESPTGTGEPNAHTRAVGAATPICFEMTNASVVHDLVFTDADERDAGVIVQLTNDGWFGDWTGGKAHHLMLARWRAVELATPVVRAANTGISAHIDAEGRVVSFLPADVDGVLVASVEPADGPARPAVFASPIIGAGSAAVVGVVAALGLTGIAKRRLTSQRPRPSRGNDAAEAPATQEEHPPEPGTPRARTSDQPRCASSDAALQSSNAAARQIDGAVDTEIDTPTRGDARAPHRRTNP